MLYTIHPLPFPSCYTFATLTNPLTCLPAPLPFPLHPPLSPSPQRYTSAGKDIGVLSEGERFVASLAAVPRAAQRLACWGLRYVAAEKHATALATLQVGDSRYK
jgi:hypothetical protein